MSAVMRKSRAMKGHGRGYLRRDLLVLLDPSDPSIARYSGQGAQNKGDHVSLTTHFLRWRR